MLFTNVIIIRLLDMHLVFTVKYVTYLLNFHRESGENKRNHTWEGREIIERYGCGSMNDTAYILSLFSE